MAVKRTWEIRIKNGNECVASVRVPEYTGIDICPVYERCGDSEPTLKWGGEIKLNPEWNGEIAIGKPSYCELVWHRTSDVLPIIDGRYLICTGVAMWPVIAHICVCRPDVIWSRLIKGTHERIDTDEVYWWAEIPLPREKN